jgi:hypothetical protein
MDHSRLSHTSIEPRGPMAIFGWFGRRLTRKTVAPPPTPAKIINDENDFDRSKYKHKLRMSHRSSIYVTYDGGVIFDGHKDDIDEAARATMAVIRDMGNGVVTLRGGTEDYNLSAWAHAQLMRMVVLGYAPPSREEGQAYIETLRVRYARWHKVIRPFSPPERATTKLQQFYAQQSRMTFGGQFLKLVR